MQYTDEYFGRCNDEFNDLMELKDIILFNKRNNRLFDLYGRHKQDPVNENGHSYYDDGDPFTEDFNKKDEGYALIIENNTPVLDNEKRKKAVLDNFRKNVILYSTLVDSEVFQQEIKDRNKRGEDLLEIIGILKNELENMRQGYSQLLEGVNGPAAVNIVTGNRPFQANTRNIHEVNLNAINYPEVRYLNQNHYQPTRLLQKGYEIYTVPTRNVHPLKVSLETRKRTSKTREKKKARYFKAETRKRTSKTREAKKARLTSARERPKGSKI